MGIGVALSAPQDLGNESPMLIPVLVNGTIHTHAMIDTGASGQFVDQRLVDQFGLPVVRNSKPMVLTMADDSSSTAGPMVHLCHLVVAHKNHQEHTTFQVTNLKYPLILGKTWIKHHNPSFNWANDSLDFTAENCSGHFISPVTALSDAQSCISPSCPSLPDTPALPAAAPSPQTTVSSVAPTICTLSLKALKSVSKKEELEICRVSVQQLQDYIEQSDLTPEEEQEKLLKVIPSKYHDLLPLFSKHNADILPPHRDQDHAIKLVPGAKFPKQPMFDMTPLELQALRKYLDENLAKGFIVPSSSPYASSIFFVKKPGSLRVCVDYRALNDITVKDVTSLPRINESLRHASAGKIFTKLDLRSAYHLIRIKEGDEQYTTFKCRYGNFEYKVMPFGLTNAPATCQKFVTEVLSEYLDLFCVCYLDDILIYSESQEEHDQHVRKVLYKLAMAGLFVKGEKCEFDRSQTTFLGFIISNEQLSMDPAKVSTVKDWESPKTVKGVRSFLGFANFYRRFIKDFSRICAPLFELTKKSVPFVWTPECEKAFVTLKDLFCSSPILKHFDHTLETVIETDASDKVISGVMSQYHSTSDGRKLFPVAYFSSKMDPAQCNYGVGDKEALAIVECLKTWRFMLESLEKPALVLTDHKNLCLLQSLRTTNRRQKRWAMELSGLPFQLSYRPGSQNSRADALTRRLEDLTTTGDALDRTEPIIPPARFIGLLTVEDTSSAVATDTWAQSVITAVQNKASKHPDVDLAVCRVDPSGLLYVNDMLYLPESLRLEAIQSCHENPTSGHPGQKGTFELLSRQYFWPKMRETVAQFVRNCDVCQRIKTSRHAPYGYLKPLAIPQARWTSVSLDFITGLPSSDSMDMIMVVVDRLSKMAHFVPCLSTLDSAGYAKLYLTHIYRLHGLPLDMVSDRGSVFTSGFTTALSELLGVKQSLSTAFHPQTDGQTERVNAILEQYLRGYCNYRQDNWVELLPLAEFCYNNSMSASTQLTPFFANYGFNPRIGTETVPGSLPVGPLRSFVEELDHINVFLRTELSWAQDRMSEQANRGRSSPPVFKEGDLVWLVTKNIKTTRPSVKLDFKKIGPFPIVKKISTHAYRLQLYESMGIHDVFHVSLLEPYGTDPLPGQVNPPAMPVFTDDLGDAHWEVREVVAVKPRGPLLYKVLWMNCNDEDFSWLSLEDLQGAPDALADFYLRNPTARRP